MSKCLQLWQFCMGKARHYRFRARNTLNLTKVGVANHKVGVANLKVGGAAPQPPHQLYRKLHPCVLCSSRREIIKWETHKNEPRHACHMTTVVNASQQHVRTAWCSAWTFRHCDAYRFYEWSAQHPALLVRESSEFCHWYVWCLTP